MLIIVNARRSDLPHGRLRPKVGSLIAVKYRSQMLFSHIYHRFYSEQDVRGFGEDSTHCSCPLKSVFFTFLQLFKLRCSPHSHALLVAAEDLRYAPSKSCIFDNLNASKHDGRDSQKSNLETLKKSLRFDRAK